MYCDDCKNLGIRKSIRYCKLIDNEMIIRLVEVKGDCANFKKRKEKIKNEK